MLFQLRTRPSLAQEIGAADTGLAAFGHASIILIYRFLQSQRFQTCLHEQSSLRDA
jgi:hypothetical protein